MFAMDMCNLWNNSNCLKGRTARNLPWTVFPNNSLNFHCEQWVVKERNKTMYCLAITLVTSLAINVMLCFSWTLTHCCSFMKVNYKISIKSEHIHLNIYFHYVFSEIILILDIFQILLVQQWPRLFRILMNTILLKYICNTSFKSKVLFARFNGMLWQWKAIALVGWFVGWFDAIVVRKRRIQHLWSSAKTVA